MPELSPSQATQRLIRSVKSMSADDLLDFHNEVFPQGRKVELSPEDSGAGDRRKILDYIDQGLEIEEILDLWNVAFPGSSDVHYDDEDRLIHFHQFSEATRDAE